VCAANPEAVLELDADGTLIEMTPTGCTTSARHYRLVNQLQSCPDLVVELASPSANPEVLRSKMAPSPVRVLSDVQRLKAGEEFGGLVSGSGGDLGGLIQRRAPGSTNVVSFGSEICGDLRLAGEREWLVTNGLGGYAMGTVAGPPSRSCHGLLIAALSPPVQRTLLVSQLEVSVRGTDGSVTGLGHRQIVSFALEGTVPCWRFAVADALVEKRVWMAQGANTTTVSYRLLRGGGPLELTLTAFVQHRSHHGGERPVLTLEPLERGLRVRPETGAPFVLLSDRGRWSLEDPPLWVEGVPLAAEAERRLVSLAEHLRAATLAVTLREEGPGVTVVASTSEAPCLDGERGLAERQAHEARLLQCWQAAQPVLAPAATAWIRSWCWRSMPLWWSACRRGPR
jgi:hypothetical protein